MIPPIATTPATTIASPQSIDRTSISQPTASKFSSKARFDRVAVLRQTNPVALTSPSIKSPPTPKLISQSELPGGSSTPTPAPVTPPPAPSMTDTGSGYPNRVAKSYFGPILGFGNGTTSYGIVTKFPFSNNISIRPSAVFGNNGTNIRLPITYDFGLGEREPFERNPLITFNVGGGVQYNSGSNGQNGQFNVLGTVGADINLFEGVALVGSFNTNFGSINGTNVGLGFEF
jgi:hypothetical protein